MRVNEQIDNLRTLTKSSGVELNMMADNIKEAYQQAMRNILGCIGDMPIFPAEKHKDACIKSIRAICFQELGIKEDG